MLKFNHLISITTLTLISSLIAVKDATAVTFNELAEGFSEGASYTGFFTGEDLNNDGKITLEAGEVGDFLSSFSGNSIIPAFDFTIAALDFSQTNIGSYNYGVSLSDTSDDISFNFSIFFDDSINNLFIRIESNNTYPGVGTTTITKYTSNDFLTIETSDTTNEVLQVITVPEPPITVPEPQNLSALIALGLVSISSYLAKHLKGKKI